jgi:hypothetical protein
MQKIKRGFSTAVDKRKGLSSSKKRKREEKT